MTDILTIAASGDATKVMRDMRVRALFSPYYFSKAVLGYHKLTPHFHQAEMERFVTAWSEGETQQCVEWSRAFFKTTCFTISTSIWVVLPLTEEDSAYAINELDIPEGVWFQRVALHDQDATQLLAFEVIENAEKKVGFIKYHFEENALFRALFPEIAYAGTERPWNNKCLRIRRVGARRGDQEGTFEAIGVGGSLQSRHYKLAWLDDLVGEKARNSEVVMQQTIGWFQRLHGAFESASKSIRFVVANRWGYNDLNSYIRENEPDFKFHTRAAWEIGEDGKEVPTFPEEYDMEALDKIRAKMTAYDFSCQYLNEPTLPGEQEIALEKLHEYRVDEQGRMICSCGAKWRPSQCNRYLHYDPYNAKGPGSKSLPCVAATACAPDKHVFLLEYFIKKVPYAKLYDYIFHANDTWRPIAITYEDVGHQNMFEFHVRQIQDTLEFKSKHHKLPRIVPCKTGNKSKEIRIRESLLPVFEKAKFARRAAHQTFDGMVRTFPNGRLHDDYDILDALAQGPAVWRYPDTEEAAIARRDVNDEYEAQLGKPYCAGVHV